MERLGHKAFGVAGALILTAVATRAQDEGVKRVEELVKSAGSTVQAISEAKLQFTKTIDAYNAVLAEDAKDRKKLYKHLQREMETTDKRRAEVTRRANVMRLEADTVFKSWADAAVGIQSADLKSRSEDRLKQTKQRFGEIDAAGNKSVELYTPVMKTLQDQVTYLGHDLNAQAVASLRPDAAKLNAQAQELTKRIDETMAVANKSIDTLRPE